jgi:hypothetical protein
MDKGGYYTPLGPLDRAAVGRARFAVDSHYDRRRVVVVDLQCYNGAQMQFWDPKVKPPPPSVCPQRFCFLWREAGDTFAAGLYSTVEQALEASTTITESHCGCAFGLCTRLDPVHGDHDWYEPDEPHLSEARLPWFYFITGPENVADEERNEYIRAAFELWGPGPGQVP